MTPTPALKHPHRTVGSEDREYIRWIQTSLNETLKIRLIVDGILGPQTRNAIRSFQFEQGLTPDGIAGPQTEQRLRHIAATRRRPDRSAPPEEANNFFKDSLLLQFTPVSPPSTILVGRAWPQERKALARTYNRLGGLMQAVSGKVNIELHATLSVWHVESGGTSHIPNQAMLRFENHLFFKLWGRFHSDVYNKHFRHGGHDGEPGNPWQQQLFREHAAQAFQPLHNGMQSNEYRAFALASRLAGQDTALKCMSIGGPQLLVANFALLGYPTPTAMYQDFQQNERAQILGFFDFCMRKQAPQPGDLLEYLYRHQWERFARYYNGPGQKKTYAARLASAYQEALQLPLPTS